jgi:hypothetical protein
MGRPLNSRSLDHCPPIPLQRLRAAAKPLARISRLVLCMDSRLLKNLRLRAPWCLLLPLLLWVVVAEAAGGV